MSLADDNVKETTFMLHLQDFFYFFERISDHGVMKNMIALINYSDDSAARDT